MRVLTSQELEFISGVVPISGGQDSGQSNTGSDTGGSGTDPIPGAEVCNELKEQYDSLMPDPREDMGQFMWDALRDGAAGAYGNSSWSDYEQSVADAYIDCLETAVGYPEN